jgi:hypothetical protein
MARTYIPTITDDELKAMAERIKPVVRSGKVLFYIKEVDLKNIAYTWSPEITDRATDLKPLKEITTYHRYGYYGFFKPSIAEVLAQIPTELRETVVAFEITNSPETAADLNAHQTAVNDGYHVAVTQLYVK